MSYPLPAGESEAAVYVSAASDNPLLELITDRKQADVSARNSKGTYNASDLNRVGYAVRYLADLFTAEGYVVNVSPKTDWTAADVVYPADAEAYLADIAELRRQLTVMKSTPKTPETLEKLRYTTANDIEQILVDLDLLLRNAVAARIYYSGDLFAGEV